MNPDPPDAMARDRGRANYERGYVFEEDVAEVFRLLHYEVEHGRLFGGRQVDLVIARRFGDLDIRRAIECKSGVVGAEDIDSFCAKLQLVRREFPSASGTIVSPSGFTDAVASHAAQVGIQLTLFRDLETQLLDGHGYAKGLVAECEQNSRYNLPLYVEPEISSELNGRTEPAQRLLDEWLADKEWRQLTLLGDVGTGKTFLTRVLAHRLAKKYLESPTEFPLPLRFDLRDADRQLTLEGLVLSSLAKGPLRGMTFDVFQRALQQGRLVVILDGFDEMAARVTPRVTSRNFDELARCVVGRSKVLLTCRTHYFRSRTEEEEVVLGATNRMSSESAKDLYWDLIARKGFRIAYLRPFDTRQVEEYICRVKLEHAPEAIKKIRRIYNLMELCQRPLLLEMIVKSIDKIDTHAITAASLYEVFTNAWIHRDKWRDILLPEDKRAFCLALAHSLTATQAATIHHSELTDYLKNAMAAMIHDPRSFHEIDSEVRTASFLVRHDDDSYGFAHKSYREFFLASYLFEQLRAKNAMCLNLPRLSPEVCRFFVELSDDESLEPYLEEILTGSYLSNVSENALVLLYSARRGDLTEGADTEKFAVPMPQLMQLQGAQLDEVNLEGAALVGANLASARLANAILSRADLSRAVLTDATLDGAHLRLTQLDGATLTNASLRLAELERTSLRGADLRGVDLSEATIAMARCDGCDVSGARLAAVTLPQTIAPPAPPEQFLEQVLESALPSTSFLRENRLAFDEVYPLMRRAATAAGLRRGIDPGEIIADMFFEYMRLVRMGAVLPGATDRVRGLLRGIAHRLVYNSAKRKSLEVSESEFGSALRLGMDTFEGDEPQDEKLSAEEIDGLWRRIGQLLPADLVEILKAYYIEEESIDDIAARLEMSRGVVHRKLSRARHILAMKLDPGT